MAENRDDFILALYLGRYAGFRIHECFRIDTAAAERALRENALTVKGKGGKVRIVPIEDERILMMLRKLLARTERGHKLLVPDDVPTDRAINALELFIYRYRNEISDEGSDRRLTFHGLRRTFAVASIKSGDDIKTVQESLGHATAAFTLDVYGHVTKQMKQDSAVRMEQFIKSVSGA
ncbi:MAG TPA: hypothetical protein DEW37_10160 [Oscillibacter sp.]|nr:hypothetical protein [Oscillibacter sp.]